MKKLVLAMVICAALIASAGLDLGMADETFRSGLEADCANLGAGCGIPPR